jgi:hypothetical protein
MNGAGAAVVLLGNACVGSLLFFERGAVLLL